MGCFAYTTGYGGYFFIEITIKNVKINTTIIAMYSIIF